MQFEKSSGLNVDHGSLSSMQQSAQSVMDAYKNLLQKIVAAGSIEDRVTGERYVPTKGILDTVKAQFTGLEGELREQHSTNQGILNQHTQIVANCNQARRDAFAGAGGVVALKTAMQGARTTHSACRTVEDTNIATMEGECDKFDKLQKCDIEDQDWYASSNLNTLQPGFRNTLQSVIDQAKSCHTAVGVVSSKAAECDGNQADFEAAFCAYSQKLESTCNTHEGCYNAAVSSRNDANVSISKLEEEQQTMWRMVQRVHCYLDLLFKAADGENSEMPDQAGIQACNDLATSDMQASAQSNIGINYVDAEAKDQCRDHPDNADDADSVAGPAYQPGMDAWYNGELQSQEAHGKLSTVGGCE